MKASRRSRGVYEKGNVRSGIFRFASAVRGVSENERLLRICEGNNYGEFQTREGGNEARIFHGGFLRDGRRRRVCDGYGAPKIRFGGKCEAKRRCRIHGTAARSLRRGENAVRFGPGDNETGAFRRQCGETAENRTAGLKICRRRGHFWFVAVHSRLLYEKGRTVSVKNG